MRLSVVLAALVGIGSTALVLGFGSLFYGWETVRYHDEVQQLEADAYQEFVQRYPLHAERLQSLVSAAKKTLETALNLSVALSKQGPTLESAGTGSPGWKTVLCQSPEIAFGNLQRPGRAAESVILTGRAAQRASVKSISDDNLELLFPPQTDVWKGVRLQRIPSCAQEGQRVDLSKFQNLFVLNQAPPVIGEWSDSQKIHWGAVARILLERGDAIALVDQQNHDATVLTRQQVVGAIAVGVPKAHAAPFAVTTADHRNTFLCLAAPLEGSGSLTWGVDLRALLEGFQNASNRSLFLIEEGTLVPIYMAPLVETIRHEMAAQFLQPKILVEGFGKTKIGSVELFFQQFIPLSESSLRVLLVDAPKAPGTVLDTTLKEKAKSRDSLVTFALWVGALSTLGLVGIAWLAGRFLGAPIRRAASEINHLLVGGGIGPRPSFPPARIDEVATLDQACEDLHQRMSERAKLQRLLNAFVAPPIAKRLEEGVVHPGGGRFHCAILFADIRGFTSQSAKMRADEVIIFLNSCFEAICPAIEEFGGVIDKFVGDEVMAIFGAPQRLPNPSQAALSAAMKMRRALDEFNTARERRGLSAISMGWGIASGEVTAGIVGSLNRSNFTALGTVVNLASRLCDAAEPYEILIDEASYAAADLTDMPQASREVDLQGLGTQTVVSIGDIR
jgi:class 3 adenylate cyclase